MPAKSSSKSATKKQKAAAEKAPAQSMHSRASLILPVSRVMKMMRRDHLNERISKGAAVYMTAILEYLLSEILEGAAPQAQNSGKKRLVNRHLSLAIQQDEELNKLLAGMIVYKGGVLPHIEEQLLPKKKKGGLPEPSQEI